MIQRKGKNRILCKYFHKLPVATEKRVLFQPVTLKAALSSLLCGGGNNHGHY